MSSHIRLSAHLRSSDFQQVFSVFGRQQMEASSRHPQPLWFNLEAPSHLSDSAMALRVAARWLPGWESTAGTLLVEPSALRLSANDLDAVPPELAPLLGRTCSELTTAGDGACALHAVFGTPDVRTEELRLNNVRSVPRNLLGDFCRRYAGRCKMFWIPW